MNVMNKSFAFSVCSGSEFEFQSNICRKKNRKHLLDNSRFNISSQQN